MVSVYLSKINLKMNQKTIEKLLQFISEENRERFHKFYFLEDSLRSLYGEIIVRHVISKQLSLKNEKIRIVKNTYGKPFIENVPLYFNISHAGEWVACAFSDREVGIDIEHIKDIDLSIAKKYFCKNEYESLVSKNGDERIVYFYELWTLKESYIKWLGTGMSTPLDSFRFNVTNAHILFSDMNRDVVPFFKQYPIKNYKLSVCSGTNDFPDQIMEIDIEKVILN